MCTRSVESKCAALLAALAVLGMPNCAGAQGYPVRFDFGGPASAEDIAKVAIAIRPDGEGLPAGKGDYATGKKYTRPVVLHATVRTCRELQDCRTCPQAKL